MASTKDPKKTRLELAHTLLADPTTGHWQGVGAGTDAFKHPASSSGTPSRPVWEQYVRNVKTTI